MDSDCDWLGLLFEAVVKYPINTHVSVLHLYLLGQTNCFKMSDFCCEFLIYCGQKLLEETDGIGEDK